MRLVDRARAPTLDQQAVRDHGAAVRRVHVGHLGVPNRLAGARV